MLCPVVVNKQYKIAVCDTKTGALVVVDNRGRIYRHLELPRDADGNFTSTYSKTQTSPVLCFLFFRIMSISNS